MPDDLDGKMSETSDAEANDLTLLLEKALAERDEASCGGQSAGAWA